MLIKCSFPLLSKASVKMYSNWNAHILLMEMKNGAATLENSFAVYLKDKHKLTVQSNKSTPKNLPKRIKDMCPYKSLCMDVHSSVIHNS